MQIQGQSVATLVDVDQELAAPQEKPPLALDDIVTWHEWGSLWGSYHALSLCLFCFCLGGGFSEVLQSPISRDAYYPSLF